MRMFLYAGEGGRPACVDVYRVVGFGQRGNREFAPDVKVACTITALVGNDCMILTTSESLDDLIARYEVQVREESTDGRPATP